MSQSPTGAPVAALITPELLGEVAAAVGLREGPSGVRLIVRELAARQPVSMRDLSRAAGLPVPIVAAVCGELRVRGVVADERPVQLTAAAGNELARHGGVDVGRCLACDELGRIIPEDLWDLVEAQGAVEAASPSARVELDQAHCTPATAIRRALLLADEGALDGTRLLLLGDDDLLSAAIASVVERLALTGPEALIVLDVDDDLLAFLAQRHDGSGAFDGRRHDLRDPLPADLVGQVDVVVSDPPYTAAGARLFASRAADALRPEAGRDLFLSFGATHPDVVASAQADVIGMGFTIRRLSPGFNDYLGAGTLGGTSAMYHLRSIRPPVGPVTGRYGGELYTAADRDRPRRYTCTNCDRAYLVGAGQPFETVTDLQATGCACGAGVFAPGERVEPGSVV